MATRIDARGLRRSAEAGASSIAMTSGASTTLDVERGGVGCRVSSAAIASRRPTSVTATPEYRAAASAPSTIGAGA